MATLNASCDVARPVIAISVAPFAVFASVREDQQPSAQAGAIGRLEATLRAGSSCPPYLLEADVLADDVAYKNDLWECKGDHGPAIQAPNSHNSHQGCSRIEKTLLHISADVDSISTFEEPRACMMPSKV